MLADRTPVKLLPGEARQKYTVARGRTRNPSSAALALGSGDPASPASRLLPATAPLAVDAHGITADTRKSPADQVVSIDGARWCRRTRGRAPPAAATAQTAVIDAPPLAPALKPLELIPAIVVETIATSDALVGDGPIPLTALTFDPPTLKPIAVVSSARSGMVSSPDDDPAAGEVAHGKRRTAAA